MGFFGNDLIIARKNYYNHILGFNSEKLIEELEFQDERTEYRSGRKIFPRNFTSKDIIEFIASKMNISKILLSTKYSRKPLHARALTIVLMRSLYNFKSSDISSVLGNITQARISKLTSIGIELISVEKKYENIIEDFINCYS